MIAHCNAGQAGAAKERVAPDAGDAAGDCITSGFFTAHWISVVIFLLNKTPSALLYAGLDASTTNAIKLLQEKKARLPMLVTPLPIVTLVVLLQL